MYTECRLPRAESRGIRHWAWVSMRWAMTEGVGGGNCRVTYRGLLAQLSDAGARLINCGWCCVNRRAKNSFYSAAEIWNLPGILFINVICLNAVATWECCNISQREVGGHCGCALHEEVCNVRVITCLKLYWVSPNTEIRIIFNV